MDYIFRMVGRYLELNMSKLNFNTHLISVFPSQYDITIFYLPGSKFKNVLVILFSQIPKPLKITVCQLQKQPEPNHF